MVRIQINNELFGSHPIYFFPLQMTCTKFPSVLALMNYSQSCDSTSIQRGVPCSAAVDNVIYKAMAKIFYSHFQSRPTLGNLEFLTKI